MKLAVGFLSLYAATAFTSPRFAYRPHTSLSSARPDTSSAIEAAIKATKKYGATSPEARVAWGEVEEMDSSDNSVATQGSLDMECLADGEPSPECIDYSDKLAELSKLLSEQVPRMQQVKYIAEEIKAVKMKGTKSEPAPDSPQMRAALANARKVSDTFGADSPEARVAWAELEDIASSGLSNAMGARLDEECLVESAMEACMAIEELNRVLNLNKIHEDGLQNY